MCTKLGGFFPTSLLELLKPSRTTKKHKKTEMFETLFKDKSEKVNDYFHFRNWYNHMTSNGRRPARVTQMYFIKDGKKYTIKPPKPKTDREGNVVRIDGAENARLSSIRKVGRVTIPLQAITAIPNRKLGPAIVVFV